MSGPNPSAANSALAQRFPGRADRWQLRKHCLSLPRRPLLMGILNVTPDSFSDGGTFRETRAAVDHGLRLAADGADILDVGGESTRPYSDRVDTQDELDRVMPIVEALGQQLQIPISIDTSKAEVARQAIAAGAQIINDVTAMRGDPRMLEVALELEPGVCAMHMQGTPRDMQDNPTYDDVVDDVLRFLGTRRDQLVAAGIEPARIALDPGIGFGKSHQHNLTLAANAWRFHELGCPLLVGHSRKAFIGKLLGDKSVDRTAGTTGVALALAAQGVQIVRVHDVAPLRQALILFEATGGIDGAAACLDDA